MLQLKPEGIDLADAMARPVAICGRQLIADKSGALYWPGRRALLVADLPLRSGPGGAINGVNGASGQDGTRESLVKLAEAMDRYEPQTVIVLGEGLHAGGAAAGMAAADLEVLRILQEDRDWVWVTGDDADRPAPPQLGGRTCGELEVAGITLRPRPTPGWATHEIAASLRPAAHLLMYGYSLRRACFVGNRQRLVMPAFGASAGGVNVLNAAFRPLFGAGGMAVWMLGEEGLYPVATRLLSED
jgi:metallophosphoesterase superfamily enzyme